MEQISFKINLSEALIPVLKTFKTSSKITSSELVDGAIKQLIVNKGLFISKHNLKEFEKECKIQVQKAIICLQKSALINCNYSGIYNISKTGELLLKENFQQISNLYLLKFEPYVKYLKENNWFDKKIKEIYQSIQQNPDFCLNFCIKEDQSKTQLLHLHDFYEKQNLLAIEQYVEIKSRVVKYIESISLTEFKKIMSEILEKMNYSRLTYYNEPYIDKYNNGYTEFSYEQYRSSNKEKEIVQLLLVRIAKNTIPSTETIKKVLSLAETNKNVLFVSNSNFIPSSLGVSNLTFIDRDELIKLMFKYEVGGIKITRSIERYEESI